MKPKSYREAECCSNCKHLVLEPYLCKPRLYRWCTSPNPEYDPDEEVHNCGICDDYEEGEPTYFEPRIKKKSTDPKYLKKKEKEKKEQETGCYDGRYGKEKP
jgi:hypothetical protein